MEEACFWEDAVRAQRVIAEVSGLKAWVVPYRELKERLENVRALLPEAEQTRDQMLLEDLYRELDQVEKQLTELETRKMLSGEFDEKACFLSINAGAGGTESCDWVEMLCRMYQKWAHKRGWQVEILDAQEGEVAGLRSFTCRISGPFAYGYCKAEKGVHRLVRISPFDSNARRHTSFASVEVLPEIGDEVAVEIRSDELRIDTYRASGAGGQHVNRTDSAVRITHLPTGIVVSCQSERSQLQNREHCMKMLRARLHERERLQKESRLQEISGEKKEIAWGNQIRSYVFQPYTLVKDVRTQYEVGNIQAVMDGELDGFVNAYLKEYG